MVRPVRPQLVPLRIARIAFAKPRVRRHGAEFLLSRQAQRRKVYARFVENYASFIEHSDEDMGRPLAYPKTNGQYEEHRCLWSS